MAVLRPFNGEDVGKARQAEIGRALAEMHELAQEVAAAWTSTKSGVELVSEQRR